MEELRAIDLSSWHIFFFLLGAYLLGSIPTAYLAGSWMKGIDIRRYGSGSIGGSNAANSITRWMIVPVGLVDIAKAALPTWLALSVFELGYPLAVAAGSSATLGHNWSIFVGFTGGRGLSTIFGTLVVVFPAGALWVFLTLFLGWRLGSTVGSTVGLMTLPLLSVLTNQPAAVSWGCIGMGVLTALKRLEANKAPLPAGEEKWPVIWRRLWLDRDIANHEEWLTRRPPNTQH